MLPVLPAPPLALIANSQSTLAFTSFKEEDDPAASSLSLGKRYGRLRQETGRRMLLTWQSVSTSPPPAQVQPLAASTQQKFSWRPLWQLVYGTTSRAGLTVGAHMLAKHLAPTPPTTDPMTSDGIGPIAPRTMKDCSMDRSIVLFGLLVGGSLVFSTISAVAFAKDTAKVCRQRAKASLMLSLGGLLSMALGTGLGAYYHECQLPNVAWASITPKLLGFYMLVVRLPHSFSCSEIVHGNTPVRARAELSTHLWPLAASLMVLWSECFLDTRVPDWAGDIMFGVSLSLVVVAFALTRTDLSRLASRHHPSAPPPLATMA
jgi:hypothetical protein